MAVGRISGPLLKANLLRDGVDLAFETDLLYLDVQNGRVGIKTSSPQYDLDVGTPTGTIRTTNLKVTTQADIATFTIDSDTISSSSGTINLEPSGVNPVVYQGKIKTGNLQLSTNLIETLGTNTDLNITTTGSGVTNVNSDMLVNGDLHATGNITADGNITFGEGPQVQGSGDDTVTFVAEIASNVIPDVTNNYDLGSDPTAGGKAWRNAYIHNVTSTSVTMTDLTVNQDLDVTGTSTFNGDVTFGDANTDTVQFVSKIDSNIVPTTTAFYDLGTDALRWNVGYFSRIEVDSLVIDNNSISTTAGNDNLTLQANGNGIISIPTNNVQIDQALTVTGDTDLQTTTINGSLTQTGNVLQTGDYTQTGDQGITGNITVSSFGQFQNIRIDANEISTTITDTDLKLEAAGTGRIYIPSNDVQIDQNLTVNGTATINDLSVTTTITADSLSDGDILIENNTIATTLTDSDLELSANGTGIVSIPTNNVQIDQQLTVNGDTSLKATTINGNITQTGSVLQTGDYTQTGDTTITGNLTVSSFGQFEKIRVDQNVISTTVTDTDLQLEANGTGKIYIPTNDVLIEQNLTVNGLATIADVSVTNTLSAGSFTTGDILIDNNYITTTLTNSNLELKADGSGIISIPNNDVEIAQDLSVTGNLTVTTGTTYLKNTTVTGNITQTGDINQTGDFTTSGTVEVTGNITATNNLTVADITISGHTIESTATNTDINLVPNGTGDVVFENIRVTSNTLKSTQTNQNIVLQPQGTGSVVIDSNQSLIIPVGTDAERPASPVNGMIRYNTDRNCYEGYFATYTTWLQLSGVIDADGNTYITAESSPGANDNTLRFVIDSDLLAYIDATKLWTSRLETAQLAIYDNQITTVATDTDINLDSSGTGGVKINNLKIKNNTISNTVSNAVTEFLETGTGYVKIAGTNGVVIPAGDLSQLPTVAELGMVRFNTYYGYMEVYNGITWVNVAGSTSGISLAQAQDIGIVSALLFG